MNVCPCFVTEAPTTSKYAGSLCVTSPTGSVIEESRVRPPPNNGCPEGFDLISVVQVESGATGRPNRGRVRWSSPGNHDGYACRRLLGEGAFHLNPARPDNVYHWMDNRVPYSQGRPFACSRRRQRSAR